MTRIDVLKMKPLAGAFVAGLLLACSDNPSDSNPTGPSFANNPCLADATVTLGSAEARRVDCTNGGTTVTLAGNGASYLVVAQFATDQGVNQLVRYTLASGSVSAATASARRLPAQPAPWAGAMDGPGTPRMRPGRGQREFEARLLAQGRKRAEAGVFRATTARALAARVDRSPAAASVVPPVGSVRSFHVLSSFSSTVSTFETVGAKLVHAGNSVLFYVDTLSLGTGFTDAQLEHFGQYFDEVLAPLDTTAFGSPSDVDQNGHVIMLMSPTVNKDTPASSCASQGFVAGFFTTEDFVGPSDPNSNQGEVFYSIAPDPSGKSELCSFGGGRGLQCARDLPARAATLDLLLPARHPGLGAAGRELARRGTEYRCGGAGFAVLRGAVPAACMSHHREPAVPRFSARASSRDSSGIPTSTPCCRTRPVSPCTTTRSSGPPGAAGPGCWCAGSGINSAPGSTAAWSGVRPAGQPTSRVRPGDPSLSSSQTSGWRSIPTACRDCPARPRRESTGSRPATCTSSGLDCMRPRGPAPRCPRRRRWCFPRSRRDTTAAVMEPGTMSFFRLDTPSSAPTVTIRFAKAGGAAFPASLGAQLAVFRLPTGQ